MFAANTDCCEFVEVSAARNENVAQLFGILMDLAGLPLEMAPDHHRRLAAPVDGTLPASTSSTKKCTLSIKRRLSDACGVVAPNVRRPSLRTDLRIMRDKTSNPGRGLNRVGSSVGSQDSHCALL